MITRFILTALLLGLAAQLASADMICTLPEVTPSFCGGVSESQLVVAIEAGNSQEVPGDDEQCDRAIDCNTATAGFGRTSSSSETSSVVGAWHLSFPTLDMPLVKRLLLTNHRPPGDPDLDGLIKPPQTLATI